jgi:acylphosphatase
VFLTNLYDLYNKFKENLQTVKEKEELFKKKGKTIEAEWYNSILGFKPEEGMIEIKMFETFIKEKVFKLRRRRRILKEYSVNRIDFCYKSGEIIELQQKLSELNGKINQIDFDPNIKKENDKLGVEGTERNYYSYILPICPFTSCPKIESLKDIMKEKQETEEKMTKLIQDSKEKISDYFGGAAFVTFNKLKD